MKTLWSSEVRNTNWEIFAHGCENFAPMNSGAKIRTHELVRNFAPMNSRIFARTPFEVFLDSMESSLSQESRFMPVEDKWGSKPC